MAELHEALTRLGSVEWDEVPRDNLEPYINDCFTAGELICNSVPPLPNGTPFSDSKPHLHIPNLAKSHKEIHSSTVRATPPHKEHESLQKNWGKPMKFNKRDNPLDINVFKMAGHDRHGAWFARKSVHEGLGFDKFKRAMMREFPESMAVSGGPGAGAIRGLTADRRLERIEVKGVGKLEVYQLSAQFPGPVTPRDFMTMILSSDDVLTDKSAAELEGGKKHVPRHFMLLSKPVQHPDAPVRSGYVRGHYESVELIREIPLSTAKSKSTSNLLSKTSEEHHTRERGYTVGFAESRGAEAKGEHLDVPSHGEQGSDEVPDDPELNPVEWIMITRSDPGGGIPRFLVERGTPETMLQDVHKFFNWACNQEHIPDPDEDLEKQEESSQQEEAMQQQREQSIPVDVPNGDAQQEQPKEAATEAVASGQQPPQGSIVNNLSKAIGTGLDNYAPTAVSHMVQPYLQAGQENDLSDDSSDTSSMDSFLSAEETRRLETAPEGPEHPIASTDNLSLASGDISESSKDRKLNDHEKEVQKIVKKREKLDQQLAKKRMAEEQKLKQSQEKDETDATKQREETEKRLKKTEEKHKKEMEKLEHKKARETRKAEDKRRKKDDANKLSLVSRERDEFRSQSDLFRRENTLLREQVADLQAQNTVLAQKLGKVGGPDALKSIQDEFDHKRTRSMKSLASTGSSDSTQKGTEKKIEAEAASGQVG